MQQVVYCVPLIYYIRFALDKNIQPVASAQLRITSARPAHPSCPILSSQLCRRA